jgi:hypothetical protein
MWLAQPVGADGAAASEGSHLEGHSHGGKLFTLLV